MAGTRQVRDWMRVAYECGFRWAVETDVTDPHLPPARDMVVLGLTEAEGRAALGLVPEVWWLEWGKGWIAGAEARIRARGNDA